MSYRATILRPAHGIDCTNDGVSSRETHVRLLMPDEPILPADLDPPGPSLFYDGPTSPPVLLRLRVMRHERTPAFGSKEYFYAEPVEQPEGLCGPMDGGNYLLVSGPDAHHAGLPQLLHPIPIHDRFETWAEAEALSR